MATTAADATATVAKEQTTANGAASGAEQVTRHSEVGHKSLLQSDALYQEPDDHVGGRGPVPQPAHQAHRRQEDHGDRRLHRLLPPRHRTRHPRRRNYLGHGHQPRELRDHRQALHREGRRRPQDRLPRGPRAPGPRRAAPGRGQPRHLRLRLRRRRQGQLPQLPPAPHEARQGRRPPGLRQHALERIRRAPRRRAHAQVHPLLPRLRPRAQQGARRRRPRRDLPAPRRRRHHALPPRQVIDDARARRPSVPLRSAPSMRTRINYSPFCRSCFLLYLLGNCPFMYVYKIISSK